MATQNNSASKTFLGKILYIIGTSAGLVVVLLVIGGGAALAGKVWDPEWNPFRQNPEKIINQAFLNMQRLKSFHTDARLDFNPLSKNPGNSLSFTADVNSSNPSNPIISMGFDRSLYLIMNNTDNSSPESFLFKFFVINIDKIKKSWIYLPQNSRLQNAVYLEKMESIFLKDNIYIFKKKLPDETINGQKIYHYLVTLDNSKLENTTGGIFSLEFLNKIGQVDINLAIGSKDGHMYGFKIEKGVDLSNISQDMKDSVDFMINVIFSKFNENFPQD